MLKRFAPRLPPRTRLNSHTHLVLDNARSKIVFHGSAGPQAPFKITSPSPYLVENHLPPAPAPPSDADSPNSSLCPPFHIHLKEDETFHVISGTAKFLLLDRRRSPPTNATATTQAGLTTRLANPGTTLTIPRGQIHTFRNASTTQPLHIEFGFSSLPSASSNSKSETPPSPPTSTTQPTALTTKMHRFFLNTQLYRSDCTTHSIPRSLPQVLLFNHAADVALVPAWLLALHRRARPPLLRALIERIIAPVLGRLMNVLGGVLLGQYIFGLSASYPEYYPYSSSHNPTHNQISLSAASRPPNDKDKEKQVQHTGSQKPHPKT
ncbi:hypothetical protein LTR70_004742 [Exophiala xenobiotica]|uniref:Cupin type-1 domain-containing protein n=1 Tax=Lithohypha guttulata TaxID=1690604 RepID=A0ABR0KCC8_9EURO|nr:hypothetical protein LTR24_004358 [Lithohypha guttulata]KAK5319956.1 hypothetical protein LTR70_004742 [Exophiala xenobiotica]